MSVNYKLNETYHSLKNFVLNIPSIFHASTLSIHKARNELKTIDINGIDTVVKSFKIPNIINKIAYSYFRDSKAKKSYEYSLKIGNYTPTPIAYIEFFRFGLLSNSYFISEEFKYDFTIREPLLDDSFKEREEIFKAFARFTLELHSSNIFHNDYSPGNILIQRLKEGYKFQIVDINRMKFFPLSEDDRAKNFSKLWADDATLNTIAREYKKHFLCSDDFVNKVLTYSNDNKRVKNFKKRLKGKPVND